MERSTSSHLVSKPCTFVLLQMDSYEVVEVKRSFACTTDLEVVMGNVCDLSSFKGTFVLLCLLLFHFHSPLEIKSQQLLESTRNVGMKCLDGWN